MNAKTAIATTVASILAKFGSTGWRKCSGVSADTESLTNWRQIIGQVGLLRQTIRTRQWLSGLSVGAQTTSAIFKTHTTTLPNRLISSHACCALGGSEFERSHHSGGRFFHVSQWQ